MNKDEIIAKQSARIAELEALLSQALSRIADLEAALKTDSRTSSKPPSSDGVKKRPAFPRRKGGKRGGQPGHEGQTLRMVAPEAVERVVVHAVEVEQCGCGASLEAVAESIGTERRQVFDLPVNLLQVCEHRLAVKQCGCCGRQHKGQFPDQLQAPVQYGHSVHALISLLSVEQSMPVGRIGELFTSLTGYALNENTVASSLRRMYERLEAGEALIKAQLLSSAVAHADETGVRLAGKLHWTHSLVTKLFTHLFVHQKRGSEALLSRQSVAGRYRGTLVHDCWGSYFQLGQARHALCGAHLLRELSGLSEHHQRQWSRQMHALLMEAYLASEKGQASVSPDQYQAFQRRYRLLLRQARQEEPPAQPRPRGRPKKSKGLNLLERLEKYETYVLRFLLEADVPFTNNLAERDIRPVKTKLKVSGCFRTLSGAQHYARIKSFCSTAGKHGLSAYEELLNAWQGHSFLSRYETA